MDGWTNIRQPENIIPGAPKKGDWLSDLDHYLTTIANLIRYLRNVENSILFKTKERD